MITKVPSIGLPVNCYNKITGYSIQSMHFLVNVRNDNLSVRLNTLTGYGGEFFMISHIVQSTLGNVVNL